MASRQAKNFKKTLNRDVTQTDQKEAADEARPERSKSGSKKGSRNRRGTRGGSESGKQGYYSYNDNAFAWYNTNQQLLATAAQIAFSEWAGDTIKPSTDGNVQQAFPGLMAFQITPTFGLELLPTDPLNVAAQKLWAYIFRTVSGQAFANAPDMMIYLLGMCEVYSYITWLERLYGEVNKWESGNTYMPEVYAQAEGVNFSDLRLNRLGLANAISMLIDQASSLRVPKDYTLFQRRAFMFQNIYTEGLSTKSQQYMFVPSGFMIFRLNPDNKSGELHFTSIPANATVSSLLNYGQNMINALLASEDTKKLSSLVLRAFGDAGIIALNDMPLDYKTPLVYSLEVLEQMKNADVIPFDALTTASLDLLQDPSTVTLKYNLTSTSSGSPYPPEARSVQLKANAAKIITTGVADPGPEVAVINTRLCCRISGGPATFSIIPASELCTKVVAYYKSTTSSSGTFYVNSNLYSYSWLLNINTVDLAVANMNTYHAIMSAFKFHPAYVLCVGAQASSITTSFAGMPVFDVDNWTILDKDVLQNLNRTVMYNLLSSDNVAKAWQG